MSAFIFHLDTDTAHLQHRVKSGLETRFRSTEFDFNPRTPEGFENSIIPMLGKPHPTKPDVVVVDKPPQAFVDEVREFYDLLLQDVAAAMLA